MHPHGNLLIEYSLNRPTVRQPEHQADVYDTHLNPFIVIDTSVNTIAFTVCSRD